MSQTVTPTNTWTSTVPPVLTPTFTPTTAGTAVAFEITGMPSYPNPYNAKMPLNVRFNTTRDLINIMFRLYTASFRLVLKENEGAYLQGDRTMQVAAANLAGFSNGIYYYNIEGTDNNGKKARGRIGTVIILK